jgi:hypothetical protein
MTSSPFVPRNVSPRFVPTMRFCPASAGQRPFWVSVGSGPGDVVLVLGEVVEVDVVVAVLGDDVRVRVNVWIGVPCEGSESVTSGSKSKMTSFVNIFTRLTSTLPEKPVHSGGCGGVPEVPQPSSRLSSMAPAPMRR